MPLILRTEKGSPLTYEEMDGNLEFLYSQSLSGSASGSGGGTPGGSNQQIQFNSASVFSGSEAFIFNYESSSFGHGLIVNPIGTYSHAQGYNSTAQGEYSHAEGQGNTTYGDYSHAEGGGNVAVGNFSHAEGEGCVAGSLGYSISGGIIDGVFYLNSEYGDLTALFTNGTLLIIEDSSGQLVSGVSNTYVYTVDSSTLDGESTVITLTDTSINVGNTSQMYVGLLNNSSPTLANQKIGWYSHAEGVSSVAIGKYSHVAGTQNRTVGWGQTVVGLYNNPISDLGAFIVGNGDNVVRNNLIVASSQSGFVVPLTAPPSPMTGSMYLDLTAPASIKFWDGSAWISSSLA